MPIIYEIYVRGFEILCNIVTRNETPNPYGTGLQWPPALRLLRTVARYHGVKNPSLSDSLEAAEPSGKVCTGIRVSLGYWSAKKRN
jgi:hypothetical protein